jgi:distribution and morphology protein 10
MVAGCELWRQSKKSKSEHDNLEWARRKMRMHDFGASQPGSPTSPLLEDPARSESPMRSATNNEPETSDSVIKLRVDQSWNVRLLWEGRVKELLVSAGVGLGPGSFSQSPSLSVASGSGSAQSGGGAPGMSYWRGVGVSVLYSS